MADGFAPFAVAFAAEDGAGLNGVQLAGDTIIQLPGKDGLAAGTVMVSPGKWIVPTGTVTLSPGKTVVLTGAGYRPLG